MAPHIRIADPFSAFEFGRNCLILRVIAKTTLFAKRRQSLVLLVFCFQTALGSNRGTDAMILPDSPPSLTMS
jgi:hypothetical protein